MDQLGLGHRSHLAEPLLPFQHGDTGIGELLPQLGRSCFIVHNSVARKKLPRLCCNAVHIPVSRDGNDRISKMSAHIQCLCADRASRAQNCNLLQINHPTLLYSTGCRFILKVG